MEIKEIQTILTVEKVQAFKKPPDNSQIIIPAARVKFPLTARNPGSSDKYIKMNTSINQKVIEMIRSSGIPAQLRNLCPLVLNGDGEIIWSMGSPPAERFKVVDKRETSFVKIISRCTKD